MKPLILIALIALLLIAASYGTAAYYLGGNQSLTLICKGDEFIVHQYSETELYVTCRVWVLSR